MPTIATWNVNSLRVRLPHVLEWLARHQPAILCLQETKLPDDQFPVEALRDAGYHCAFFGQKTYNGVATLTREPVTDIVQGLAGFDDEQRRVLVTTCGGVRVLNVYVPNGQEVGSEKYEYKLRWLKRLAAVVDEELSGHDHLVLLGDFNVAPEARDVHDPQAWEGRVLFSEPEREALQAVMAKGLHDTFRRFEQDGGHYTWWDYRQAAFRRDMGLRIDHILASNTLAEACTSCWIDREARRQERPSDHAPVMAEFVL